MRHYITVGILVIVAAIGTYFGLDALELMPVAASAQAVPIDWMWNWQVIAISFLFALIVVPLMYSLIVFRRKKGDTSDAEHIEGHTNLEIGWTIAPLFIVMAFAYMGSYSLSEVRRVDPQAMIVKVHARQFSWTFEYPEQGGFMSNELHLPVDRQVLLQMDSTDVIHSFWIPEFRVKQDVVPGRVTELRVTPTLINLPSQPYKVRCAELCGSAHYSMESKVFVSDEATFLQWAAEQQAAFAAAQTPEDKGKLIITQNGCTGCHSLTGESNNGPTWKGLFGSQVKLADGTTVTADEAFIKESILTPSAKIVAGFETANPMQPYPFTEEELSYIIAFIMSLK